jgi:VWFA-related protein
VIVQTITILPSREPTILSVKRQNRHETTKLSLVAAVCLGSFVAVAIAQQTLVVDVNLRLLTVRVRNPQGQPVLDLTSEDFEILEDGRLRAPSHLFIQRQSAALGLLVDRSISVDTARSAAVAAVGRICDALGPDDQAFLMTFSTATKTDVSWTADPAPIVSAIQRLRPAAGTRLYDAIVDALDELSRSRRPRKALMVLTDGADHYSTHTLQQVIDIARLYNSEIDVIAYQGDDRRSWTPAGRGQISSELQRLATATGGQLLSSSSDIKRTAEALHIAYQLGFYSSEFEPSPVEIRIRNHPELTVLPALSADSFEK